MPGPLAYAGAFIGSLMLAWVLTPVMLRLAVRLSLMDLPGDRKTQATPVPYLGGLAIVLAFAVAVVASAAVYHPAGALPDLGLFLGVGSLLALMGLVDDLRGLSPLLRLGIEVGAGVAVWGIGNGVELPGPTGTDIAITVFWVVGVTNAFNLLDNMDGLSAGTAAIAAWFFFALALITGQWLVAALAIAVAGCATGFLRHNFHPAKIYMGDAGILFLGFLLAVIGIRLRLAHTPPAVAVFVPVLVLGAALFDTILVTVNRLRHGLSPLKGGRDHTSHRLVFVGISVPVSVGLIYMGGLALGWLAVILERLDTISGLLLVSFVFVVGLAGLVLLSGVPVYATSRQRRSMLRVVRQEDSGAVDLMAAHGLTAAAGRIGIDERG